jgi:hypothetical protein
LQPEGYAVGDIDGELFPVSRRRRRQAANLAAPKILACPLVRQPRRASDATLAVAAGVLGEWQNREEPPDQDQP